jgi:type I restriction enzyme S subunit
MELRLEQIVIPEGWREFTIGDVVERVPNVKPELEPERDFGYVDISSIDNSRFEIIDRKRIKGKDAPSRARRPIRPGDVLFSNVRTYLRNIALVGESLDVDICSTGFTVLRPKPCVDSRFLFRYVLSDEFIDRITPTQTGTHYPATSDRMIFEESIRIPALSEQRRIVAKVEPCWNP